MNGSPTGRRRSRRFRVPCAARVLAAAAALGAAACGAPARDWGTPPPPPPPLAPAGSGEEAAVAADAGVPAAPEAVEESEPTPAAAEPVDAERRAAVARCARWVERDDRLYRAASWAEVATGPELPGRVTLAAHVAAVWDCGPCPRGHHCEPCATRVVLQPFEGAPDDDALTVFGTAVAGECRTAYLALRPGYSQHRGTAVDSDPRAGAAWLEASEPAPAGACAPETPGPMADASCDGGPVGEGPAPVDAELLPTPVMLDDAEQLRRAEVLFARGDWAAARDRYVRLARSLLASDPATWWFATYRSGSCALHLGDAVPAVEQLRAVLTFRCREEPGCPALRLRAAADLGRAAARLAQNVEEAETLWTGATTDAETAAAFEALAAAWEDAGRERDARAARDRAARVPRAGP